MRAWLTTVIPAAAKATQAFVSARRKRQLEHLQSRFRGVHAQQPDAEELLARWYALAASPDAAMDQRVAAVVRRLLEQGQPAAAPPQVAEKSARAAALRRAVRPPAAD